ncbi:sulfite exporter TauE/SafE family protein [Oceanobacillus halophilus]|uniref:Probable membrane transporter protein n=1 Tax=Oceanobacillus halophilus TaxID=930130 RepID=A0A495A7S4_9BACI|nr:sulfite exporter TauE/SafE family protein [Oceanobacillus halophilus]RKQ35471.1 sulfite exporter TauE/SafE family protein [Oceanobacillus halophilus]
MVFIICLVIGMLTAFIGSIAGLGGGIILVPSLFFMYSISPSFAWANPQTIVGISLITMIFTGLASTLSYLRAKRVDYKTGLLFLSGSLPGGIIGSWLNEYINAQAFLIYFGILMVIISLLFFIKKDKFKRTIDPDSSGVRTGSLYGETFQYRVTFVPAFILSFIVGILSGLFGIGGGSIMVPAMMLLFGIPAHIATATSMFMIFFVSIFGAGTHVILGHIAWEYVFFFIPGALLGGVLGAKVNQLLPSKSVEWILRILLIFIGLRMVFQGIS